MKLVESLPHPVISQSSNPDPALMQPQRTHISKNPLFLSLLPVSRVSVYRDIPLP